jgi:glycogen debranching enzyme
MPQPRQPFLHDLVCTLAAPTQALSAYDGQIGRTDVGSGEARGTSVGAQGVLHADVRVLSTAELLANGERPEHIATIVEGAATRFIYAYRGGLGSTGHPDELVRIDRLRRVEAGELTESLEVQPLGRAVALELSVRLAYDLAPVERIKTGTADDSLAFEARESLHWGDPDLAVELTCDGAALAMSEDARTAEVRWTLALTPGRSESCAWSIAISDRTAVVVAADGGELDVDAVAKILFEGAGSGEPSSGGAGIGRAHIRDNRLESWLDQSLLDLNALRMGTRDHPDEIFFAAGAPWYLTLFGRDSLWTARMLLSVDPRPAIGALRTLARLAGRVTDHGNAEEPGKILHELRRGEFAFGATSLPPLYYGTIDATPLWVCLLHDLWLSGGQDEVVRELLAPLEAALSWIVTYGDADGDGFLEYVDASGRGLANQGWKDSEDSVRFADGRIAVGSVALCEVQGYAYEALIGGADVLEAFDRPGPNRYRRWAAILAERFRAEFWCGDGAARYPALALDGRKQRVDSLTSNIGHLLGTGILNPDEEVLVADRIAGSDLDSGLGLRTMSARDGGYNPLSYHCGSVWPHDTAIVIAGLQRAGLGTRGDGLIDGMLRASVAFDQRLPELWSGEGRPVPYPASCRPQAWSAAAAVVVARALRGS